MKKYVEVDTFKNKWLKYSQNNRSRKIVNIIEVLDKYDSAYVDSIIARLKDKSSENRYRREWDWMIVKRWNFEN